MAPSQLLPVLATPKTQMNCSGGIPPMVVSLSPAARRALSREISRSLETSCSCRRSGGLPSTSAEPGTSPRIIPTSNLKYALTSLATSNTARCCKFGTLHLPRVRARISAPLFSSSSASRILPSPIRANRADQAGPAAKTLYCPLPPQQANRHDDRLFRWGLVTCGSPSATCFVSADTVVFADLTASGAWYPRLTVESAFLREVD